MRSIKGKRQIRKGDVSGRVYPFNDVIPVLRHSDVRMKDACAPTVGL